MTTIKSKITLFTLLVFLTSVWSLAFYSGQILHNRMEQLSGEQQFSTVSFMATEINEQLATRLKSLEIIASQINVAKMANHLSLQTFLEQNPLLQILFNGGFFVTDRNGIAIADVPLSAKRIGVNYIDRSSISDPLKYGKPLIGKPAMGKKLGAPIFSISVPIRDAKGSVIGVFAGTINLNKPSFLDKLTDSHYGKTGGYLLVAPQYGLVVTATDKSRIMTKVSPSGANKLIDKFMQGYEGSGVLVNSLGAEVLASAKQVPVAGWYVAASLPVAEAFAPIQEMKQQVLIAALIMTIFLGSLIWWVTRRMLRQQLSPMFAASRALSAMSDSSYPTQPLIINTNKDEIGELIDGFNRLLTVLKQREEALLEIGNELEEAQLLAGTGSWTYDPIVKKSELSKGMFHIWGIDHSLGLFPVADHQKYIHPDDFPRFEAVLKEALDNGTPYKEELRIIRPDGIEKTIITICDPICDATGKVTKLRGTNQDINERKQADQALRRIQNMLTRTESITHTGSWEWEVATDIVTWSEELFRIVKCDPANGAPSFAEHSKIYHPDDMVELERVVGIALSEGTPYEIELRLARPNGEIRHCLVRGFAESNPEGRVLRLFGSLQDISEQKSAEEALLKSEQKYRQLFQNQPSGYALHEIIVDEDGKPFDYRFLEINPAFEILTGLKASDLVGKTQREVMPNSEPYWVETYGNVALTGTTISFDNYSGVLNKHYHVVAYSPEPGKFATVFIDITDLKEVEDALKESEYRWKFALEGAGDGVWDWNIQTGQAFYSGRYKEMLGFAGDEIGNTSDEWMKRLHPEDAPGVMAALGPYLAGKAGSASVEFRMLCKDGSWKWILGRGIVVSRDSDGNPLRMIGTNTDLTDRKKAEEEKQTLEHQLQHTQKLESLGVLSGGIAHDFNNILAIIIGYCGLIKMDYETTEQSVEEIEKAAERAAVLCRQMLTYAGKAQLTKTQVNMRMLVDEMLTMLKASLPQNAVIMPDIQTNIPFITADASQIKQIIINLIINASEAIGEEQGEIRVSLAETTIITGQSEKDYHGKGIPSGRYILLEVADTGCGMDEETKWRIFEPFYTTKFAGRGLGMSAILGIINSHNGALQLFSQLGKGTTFKVYLPVPISSTVGDEDQNRAATAIPWKGSGTILLVEDEDQIRHIAKSMLEMFGFNVIEAVNGKQALELYQKDTADITLVLTDMGMPVMDGYALLPALKQLNSKLPIVVSSGFGDADITSRIGRDNIAGIIGKPYNLNQLREVLKSALGC